jgi:hypothetical protein
MKSHASFLPSSFFIVEHSSRVEVGKKVCWKKINWWEIKDELHMEEDN